MLNKNKIIKREELNNILLNKNLPIEIINNIYDFYTKSELILDKKKLKDKLPENITHLTITKYNEIIYPTTFPFSYQNSLQEIHIDISSNYDSSFIEYSIPQSVIRIIINNKYNKKFSNVSFPKGLKELIFSRGSKYITEIPLEVFYERGENMKLLILSGYYNSSISFIRNLKNLEVLSFDIELFSLLNIVDKTEYNYYNKSFIDNLIRNEKYYEAPRYPNLDDDDSYDTLCKYSCFNRIIIPGFLPKTLKELYLSKAYNIKLEPGILPKGLKVLVFDRKYEHSFDYNVLPESLEVLVIDNLSNLKPGILPKSLKELYIKYYESSDKGFNVGDLPDGLEILSINNYFCKKKITKNIFSPGLKKFYTHMDINFIFNELPDTIELLHFPGINQKLKLFDYFPKNLKNITVHRIYAIRNHSWMKRLPNDVRIRFC